MAVRSDPSVTAPTVTAPTVTAPTVTAPTVTAPTGTAPARWLSDTEQLAWRAYVETVGDLTTALESDLASTGLTLGDYQVLVYLSEAPAHRLRMCDLASALQLSPSGLTRRLDGLVRRGLVLREGSPADRRVMLAVLTDLGQRTLAEAAPIHVDSVRRRIFEQLGPDEVSAMATIFGAIGRALGQPAPGEPALEEPAPGEPAPGEPAPGEPAPGEPQP